MQKAILFFATISVLFTACNSSKQSVGTREDVVKGSATLYQYKWNLTELQGKAIISNTDSKKPHLFFSKKSRVTGNTGCNSLSGSFTLSGSNDIAFTPLAVTRMACVGDNNETLFLQALSEAKSWSITNNELSLSDGNKVTAKFNGSTKEKNSSNK